MGKRLCIGMGERGGEGGGKGGRVDSTDKIHR